MADHLTAFADDLHVSSLIKSYFGLDRFCQSLGVVLHTLRQHGMVINVQKVAVIIALNGPSRRQALSEFTRKVKVGQRSETSSDLLLRRKASASDSQAAVPRCCHQLPELCGALSSDETTEMQGCSNSSTRCPPGASGPLPGTAHSSVENHGATVRHVRSRRVWAFWSPTVLRQLRAISRTPAHITHESDHTLLSRLGIPAPQLARAHQHERTLRRLDPDDQFVMQQDHPWMQHLSACWSANLRPSTPTRILQDLRQLLPIWSPAQPRRC